MTTTETLSEIGNPRPWIRKDPSATLDYTFDWTDWLTENGDAIASYSVSVDGVTKDTDSRVGAQVTAWVSGGTVGDVASVTCRVTTNSTPARVDERTIYLRIENR